MATKKKQPVKAAKKAAPAKKATPAKKTAKAAAAKTSKTASKPVAKKAAPAKTAKKAAAKPAGAKNKPLKKAAAKTTNTSTKKSTNLKKEEAKKKTVATKKATAKSAPAKSAPAKATKAAAGKVAAKKTAAPKTEEKAKTAKTAKESKGTVEVKAAKEVKETKATKPAAKAAETKKAESKPAAPKKVVIPEIKTTTSVKYEPEFTKSVLDNTTEEPKGPMVRYSDAELQEFKELIQKKYEQAKKELAYLQGLITRKDDFGGGENESRYMTMEDGSMSMEREQLSQMASRQITYIDHLEKALIRIENKTYGICRVTGKLIDKARLRAVPHATLSIEAKQAMNK